MAADAAARPYAPRQVGASAVAVGALQGRAPTRLPLDGVALTVGFAACGLGDVRGAGGGDALACLEWSLDGVAGELLLPLGIVVSLVAPLEETPDGALDWAVAPMLLELLLAPHLDRAEALLGQTFRFRALRRERAPDAEDAAADAWVGVAVRGDLDGTPFAAWLRLAPNALDAAAWLARLAPAGPQRVPDPLVVIAARVGLARLGLAALASVQVGDAVLIEDGPLRRGQVMIVVGESRVAAAGWTGNEATLREPLRAPGAFGSAFGPAGGSEEWTMQSGQEGDPIGETFGELRVTLVFEVGRRLATLNEVRALAPGQVLHLGRDETAPVDILANGARLGRGEIVKVGDALAVRITGLHGHD